MQRNKSNFCKRRILQLNSLNQKNMTGKIKRLTDKGFGFIASDETPDKDVFFHSSALSGVEFNDLREGDAVSFETEDSEKGPRAVNVTRS